MNSNMLCDLSEFGLLKVTGTDAKKFLQGQLTCDLEKITATHSSMGAHCHPQGRIISLFYLFLWESAYFLLMPRLVVPLAIAALEKYAVFYKVSLTEVSDHYRIIGEIEENSPLSQISSDIKIIPLASSTTKRRMIIISCDKTNPLLDDLAKEASMATQKTWSYLDLCDGIPTLYPKTSLKFLPHEINLHQLNAIDFDKGCYTGQEIIARMHYRGKLKNRLYRARIAMGSPPLPATLIYSLQGKEMRVSGTLVNACFAQDHTYQALIVIEESHAKNNHLFLEKDKGFITIVSK